MNTSPQPGETFLTEILADHEAHTQEQAAAEPEVTELDELKCYVGILERRCAHLAQALSEKDDTIDKLSSKLDKVAACLSLFTDVIKP